MFDLRQFWCSKGEIPQDKQVESSQIQETQSVPQDISVLRVREESNTKQRTNGSESREEGAATANGKVRKKGAPISRKVSDRIKYSAESLLVNKKKGPKRSAKVSQTKRLVTPRETILRLRNVVVEVPGCRKTRTRLSVERYAVEKERVARNQRYSLWNESSYIPDDFEPVTDAVILHDKLDAPSICIGNSDDEAYEEALTMNDSEPENEALELQPEEESASERQTAETNDSALSLNGLHISELPDLPDLPDMSGMANIPIDMEKFETCESFDGPIESAEIFKLPMSLSTTTASISGDPFMSLKGTMNAEPFFGQHCTEISDKLPSTDDPSKMLTSIRDTQLNIAAGSQSLPPKSLPSSLELHLPGQTADEHEESILEAEDASGANDNAGCGESNSDIENYPPEHTTFGRWWQDALRSLDCSKEEYSNEARYHHVKEIQCSQFELLNV